MGLYPARETERAMKVQEVILRAMSGQIKWFQAAEILGMSARGMRRWRWRLEQHGYSGLFDRRTQRPSPKRVPLETVETVLQLYREKYFDFNVRHFHEILLSEHGIELSYTWVKSALQMAGLVARRSKRGRHHKRRPRRPLPGMLLHIDGSSHHWLGADCSHDLITVMDDATSEIYYGQLVEQESTATVMAALRSVIEQKGLFCSLYTDRASHFVHTPKAGEGPNRERLTQVGRALEQLGIELIPAGSPQARGRANAPTAPCRGAFPRNCASGASAVSSKPMYSFARPIFQSTIATSPCRPSRRAPPFSHTPEPSSTRSSHANPRESSATTTPSPWANCDSRSSHRHSASAWPSAGCWSASTSTLASACTTVLIALVCMSPTAGSKTALRKGRPPDGKEENANGAFPSFPQAPLPKTKTGQVTCYENRST